MTDSKILLVEDNVIVALGTKMMLEDIGYMQLRIVASEEDAMMEIAEWNPDIVITDLNLSGRLAGLSLAEEMISKHGLQVILLTAYSDKKIKEQAKQIGCSAYLIKPVDPEELKAAIEQSLNGG